MLTRACSLRLLSQLGLDGPNCNFLAKALNGDIPWQAPNHKVKQSFNHVVLQDRMANKNHHISITRVFTATNALITWSCKVTWQTKIIIYSQPECLWLQTWQSDGFPWLAPTYNVAWPFDHMVLWDTRFTYVYVYLRLRLLTRFTYLGLPTRFTYDFLLLCFLNFLHQKWFFNRFQKDFSTEWYFLTLGLKKKLHIYKVRSTDFLKSSYLTLFRMGLFGLLTLGGGGG